MTARRALSSVDLEAETQPLDRGLLKALVKRTEHSAVSAAPADEPIIVDDDIEVDSSWPSSGMRPIALPPVPPPPIPRRARPEAVFTPAAVVSTPLAEVSPPAQSVVVRRVSVGTRIANVIQVALSFVIVFTLAAGLATLAIH